MTSRLYYKHSFATQRLKENGFRIFNNGNEIMKYQFNYPLWEINPVETKIRKGIPLFKGNISKTKVITNYDDLLHYNVMISKRKPKFQRFLGQKREYFLTKYTHNMLNIGGIPPNHYVEINPQTKEFRLIGDNSMGEWFQPFYREEGIYYGSRSLFDNTAYNYKNVLKRYLGVEGEIEYSDIIEEIVLGISDDGKLICIQEEKENPTIGILGHKRHGKSFCKHRIMDITYHKWKKKVIELNDILMETDTYCQTWNPIIKFSDLTLINENSIPLPMVYLHPKTRTLRNMIAPKETGFEIYLSFKDFILDYNNVLKGKEEWTFNKAGVYFRNLLYDSKGNLDKDGLAYCKNYEQMEAVVYKKLLQDKTEEQKKTPSGVIPKILNVLKDIDNAKILDVSNKTKAKWEIEFPDGHKEEHYSWTCCLIADLVPSIVTNNINHSHPDFHPQYSNFILNDLFKNQNENDYFRDNNIELFMFFDEILSLVDSQVATETFKTIIRESGPSRIGFTYCTQSWKDIPEFIQSQTDYIISFKQKSSWAKEICDDFNALKYRKIDLVNLKKGEFIIFSSNPIILYDEYGKREEIEDEAIKGNVFPPLSAHKAPKQIGA